jgi:Uma2 family endonuclease
MASMAAPVETGRWPDHVSGEWTVESLETLPGNGLRYEILDGTLLVTPSPTPGHQGVIVELAVLLRAACPADVLDRRSPGAVGAGVRPGGRGLHADRRGDG